MGGVIKQKIDRDLDLDRARSGLIVLVVYAHLVEFFISNNSVLHAHYKAIYAVHMPAFVILAGCFSHQSFSAESLKKSISTLLIPLIVFTIIFEVTHFSSYGEMSKYLVTASPYWILWFLLSLFFWRLLLPVFLSTGRPLTLAVIFALIAGSLPLISYQLSLSRSFYFFPFFVFGYLLNRDPAFLMSLRYLKRIPPVICVLFLAGITLAMFYLLSGLDDKWFYGSEGYHYFFNDNILLKGAFIRAGLLCLGLVGGLALIRILMNFRIENFITAKNTLWVYLLHALPLIVLSAYISKAEPEFHSSAVWTILIMISCLVLAIIMSVILSNERLARLLNGLIIKPVQKVFFLKS